MPSIQVKRLPEANEFSPGQINLHDVLMIVDENHGDREKIMEAIRQKYFSESALKHIDNPEKMFEMQQTRAYNVMIGMKGYRLLDFDTYSLTDIGKALLAMEDEKTQNNAFAKHILTSCHGVEVLEAVRDIQSRGDRVSKLSLSDELKEHGFTLPRATTHHTKLIQWLRTAMLIDDKYNIDENAFSQLTGVGLSQLEEWSALTLQQHALLRTLRQLVEAHGSNLISAKDVIDLATVQYGRIFKEDQLRAQVFRPLSLAGWITLSSVGHGRGGKSGKLAATEKLLNIDFGIVTESISALPSELREMRNRPLAEIYRDLNSEDTYTKGIALEVLSIRIATSLGLTPIDFRLRARDTGGGEVDLVAEGAHLHFSRWLFQCKNTKTAVPLSALAKEIGMATLLRANVIVMVTTSDFSESVKKQTDELAKLSPLQAVLVNGEVLNAFQTGGPQSLMSFFHHEAAETMRIKRIQLQ